MGMILLGLFSSIVYRVRPENLGSHMDLATWKASPSSCPKSTRQYFQLFYKESKNTGLH